MTEEEALNRIRECFPELTWNSYEFLTHGWDHVVVVLGGEVVIRIPREPAYQDALSDEIRLLDYLREKVDVGTPHYQYIAEDRRIAGYDLLPGLELTPERFNGLSRVDRQSAAIQLAAFIKTLHETPKSVIKQFNVRVEDQRALHDRLLIELKELVFPRLDPSDRQAIERYFDRTRDTRSDPYEDVLTHADLSPEHILWDSVDKKINIIDFSDRAYGDPAIDFSGLFEYGRPFVENVLMLYGDRSGGQTLQRAEMYFTWVPLWLMIDSIRGDAPPPYTFEYGYKNFRERFYR